MNIKYKYYPEVIVEKMKVPEFNQNVIVENGIVRAEVVNSLGKKYMVRVDALHDKTKSNEIILQRLIYALQDIKNEAYISKAELKRQFIKYGLISK